MVFQTPVYSPPTWQINSCARTRGASASVSRSKPGRQRTSNSTSLLPLRPFLDGLRPREVTGRHDAAHEGRCERPVVEDGGHLHERREDLADQVLGYAPQMSLDAPAPRAADSPRAPLAGALCAYSRKDVERVAREHCSCSVTVATRASRASCSAVRTPIGQVLDAAEHHDTRRAGDSGLAVSRPLAEPLTNRRRFAIAGPASSTRIAAESRASPRLVRERRLQHVNRNGASDHHEERHADVVIRVLDLN